MLAGYEDVVPGSAERILAMAERQAAHRQNIESRGQLFGFSLAASAIAGGFLAVGLPLVGVSGVILAAATLSGFVIWGKAGGLRRIPAAHRRMAASPTTSAPRTDRFVGGARKAGRRAGGSSPLGRARWEP